MTKPQDEYRKILTLIEAGIANPSSKLGQMIQVAGITVSQQLAEKCCGKLDSKLEAAYTNLNKPGTPAKNMGKPPRPGMK